MRATRGGLNVRHHGAPAGRAVGPGKPLDDPHGVGEGQLGAAQRTRQQHRVDAGLAQRCDDAVSLPAEPLGLGCVLLDNRHDLLGGGHEVREAGAR